MDLKKCIVVSNDLSFIERIAHHFNGTVHEAPPLAIGERSVDPTHFIKVGETNIMVYSDLFINITSMKEVIIATGVSLTQAAYCQCVHEVTLGESSINVRTFKVEKQDLPCPSCFETGYTYQDDPEGNGSIREWCLQCGGFGS